MFFPSYGRETKSPRHTRSVNSSSITDIKACNCLSVILFPSLSCNAFLACGGASVAVTGRPCRSCRRASVQCAGGSVGEVRETLSCRLVDFIGDDKRKSPALFAHRLIDGLDKSASIRKFYIPSVPEIFLCLFLFRLDTVVNQYEKRFKHLPPHFAVLGFPHGDYS